MKNLDKISNLMKKRIVRLSSIDNVQLWLIYKKNQRKYNLKPKKYFKRLEET